jgi:hypothetical protein
MRLFVKDTLSGLRTRETVRTKLTNIAQRAKADKEAAFCSLAHLMSRWKLEQRSSISDTSQSLTELARLHQERHF